jgi:hypothetical protein
MIAFPALDGHREAGQRSTNNDERTTMRIHLFSPLILGSALLGPAVLAADAPPLRLSDPNLPLQELRPLDRHVWVLGLEGAWKQPAIPGVAYYVNLIFPNGQSYSHRVLNDATFRLGEVRCLIPEYQLLRNGLACGGKFTIVVSARRSVTTATATEVVGTPSVDAALQGAEIVAKGKQRLMVGILGDAALFKWRAAIPKNYHVSRRRASVIRV